MTRNETTRHLHSAKKAKNDEFYTQLSDIEKELKNYKRSFKGKIVLCNCDDPRVSNFFHYFSYNFEKLGLKKLISTCYKNQDRDLFSRNDSEQAIYLIYEGDKNNNNIPDPDEIGIQFFKGDGDFRSDDAMKYGEIYPYFQANKIWFGATMFNGGAAFFMGSPDLYDPKKMSNPKNAYIKDNKLYWRVNGVRWFTNLDHNKRHEELVLYKTYSSNDYLNYDNYDAIEVSKVVEIPKDFKGVMGVPISFMDKYNPDQFDIVGLSMKAGFGLESNKFYDSYKEVKQDGTPTGSSGKKTNGNPMLVGKPKKGNYYLDEYGNAAYSLYDRLFVVNKTLQH